MIKETLRLHSPAPGVFPRVANKDHKLDSLYIKKGTLVRVSLISMWYNIKLVIIQKFLKIQDNFNQRDG